MYGLPDSADWTFLIGKELLQVCIGLHQVSLRFDGDVSVDIECDIEHVRRGPVECARATLAERAATLVSLLGARIATATAENGKTLALAFSNQEILRIHDSNESYESFCVSAPGREIVV